MTSMNRYLLYFRRFSLYLCCSWEAGCRGIVPYNCFCCLHILYSTEVKANLACFGVLWAILTGIVAQHIERGAPHQLRGGRATTNSGLLSQMTVSSFRSDLADMLGLMATSKYTYAWLRCSGCIRKERNFPCI